jgi:predicted nucleic acid-binding protein
MIRFVLDSSYAVSWAFADERTPECLKVLRALATGDAEAFVSPLWFFEISNVLLVAEKRKRLTLEQSEAFLELLGSLPIRESGRPVPEIPETLLVLSRTQGLTAYDAAYLDLAQYEGGLPLATLDADLEKAAKRSGLCVQADILKSLP